MFIHISLEVRSIIYKIHKMSTNGNRHMCQNFTRYVQGQSRTVPSVQVMISDWRVDARWMRN